VQIRLNRSQVNVTSAGVIWPVPRTLRVQERGPNVEIALPSPARPLYRAAIRRGVKLSQPERLAIFSREE
jgi:hypothetical protein